MRKSAGIVARRQTGHKLRQHICQLTEQAAYQAARCEKGDHVMLKEATNIGIDSAVLMDIYRQMSRIHEVDKAIRRGISSGRFQFTYWPMTGQEAIPATLATLTDSKDY